MKKPFYKKWVFWVIVIVVGGIIGIVNKEDASIEQVTPAPTEEVQLAVVEPTTNPTAEPIEEASDAPTEASETMDPSPKPGVEVTTEPLDEVKVLDYTINLTGKTFIKNIDVGKDYIKVNFFKDFKEYKKENTGSMITEAEYKDYFSTGDQINKILMEESSRLFKEFHGASSIGISIPFEGKTYSVSLTKEEVEKFYEVDFNTLTSDDEWRGRISNPFFNDEDRGMFVAKFVDVK
ncbi:hypothetical protein MKY14_16225 [Paenibacillus sp. FSL R5-0887]|uniref:hypothetical protein n=1 Tax=Paenibacillus sp. FSL R5-0887 TaxID=2921662 RepID=UPI0030F87DA6